MDAHLARTGLASPGIPSTLGGSRMPASRAAFGRGTVAMLSRKWAVVHDAADVVAELAGRRTNPPPSDIRHFPALIVQAAGHRREVAEQSLDDLTALMEVGLAALLAVHARGADTSAPAAALWDEFESARAQLVALIAPGMAPQG